MSENHRVLEVIGLYLSRWGVKVAHYGEAAALTSATAEMPSHLMAVQVVEEFAGIPGPVAVIAQVGRSQTCVVFSWQSRRG